MKSFVQLAVLLASLQLQGVLAVPARMDSIDIREIDTRNGASVFATIQERDSGSPNGDEKEYSLVGSIGGIGSLSGAQHTGGRGFGNNVAEGSAFTAPTSSDSAAGAIADEKEYARPKSAEGARLTPPGDWGRRPHPPSWLKEAFTHAADAGVPYTATPGQISEMATTTM